MTLSLKEIRRMLDDQKPLGAREADEAVKKLEGLGWETNSSHFTVRLARRQGSNLWMTMKMALQEVQDA